MPQSDVENFSFRLRKRREELGIRKHELATSIGVSLTTIQQYESGQMPRGEFAVRLASELDCSLDWLLAGRDVVQYDGQSKSDSSLVRVPVVDAFFGAEGEGFGLSQNSYSHQVFYWDFLHAKGNPANMVLLRVTGDSMQPRILNNDVVLIDQDQTSLMPGYMYAISVEGMVYLKLVDAMPGKLLLSSINPNHPTIELDINEQGKVRILGRAIWLGREIS